MAVVNSGSFTNGVTITLSNALASAVLQYSADNGTNWNTYTNSFVLDGIWQGSGILQVRATKTGYAENDQSSGVYSFSTSPPAYSYDSGSYTNNIDVAITTGTTNATIEYSFDLLNWQVYSNAVAVTNDLTLYARVDKTGYYSSGQVDYSAAAGFSDTQGLNNWYYLYSSVAAGLPDTFLPLYSTDSMTWHNTTNNAPCSVGRYAQRPSATNDSVRTFVLPNDGNVSIANYVFNFEFSGTGDGVWLRILQNTNALLDWTYVTNSPASTDITVTNAVLAGDELYFQVSAIQQIQADQVLMNVSVSNSFKYVLKFYNGTNGVYATNDSPFVNWTIENPDASTNSFNKLRLTETRGASSITNDYVWVDANNEWTLTTGNGLRQEIRIRTWNTAHTVATDVSEIHDPATGNLVSKSSATYQTFNWGVGMIQKTDGDGDSARSTYYSFDSYGKLTQTLNWDGSWAIYQYDSTNRASAVYTGFGNQGPTTSSSLCRLTQYSYTPVTAAGDDGSINPFQPRMVVEFLLGSEMNRSYTIVLTNETRQIQCQTVGAAWNASDNLVTITDTYADYDFKGSTESILNSDGTMALYSYEF